MKIKKLWSKIPHPRKFVPAKFEEKVIRECLSPRNSILVVGVRESLYPRNLIPAKVSTNKVSIIAGREGINLDI